MTRPTGDMAAPCAGTNCGITRYDQEHSPECVAEHAASAAPAAQGLTDERILHLWDTHVGEPTAKHPLGDADKLGFARVVLYHAALASQGEAPPPSVPAGWSTPPSTWQEAEAYAAPPPEQAAQPAVPLTEDEVFAVIGEAERLYRRFTRGVRGQMAMPGDSLDYWIVRATEQRLATPPAQVEQADAARPEYFRTCEFCKCRTNAKARLCCNQGALADLEASRVSLAARKGTQ